MKTALKQNVNKPAHLKRAQEVQRKCSNGVKMLPVVRYERKLWFFDQRLRQLRNVQNPHDFINLNDLELEYFMKEFGDEIP